MLMLSKVLRKAAMPAAAILAIAASTATAQLLEDGDSDSADRIELATQLPTLTQQVAAASCALTSDVDVDEARDVLVKATADFDRYIVALREGDDALHILGPELHADIARDIDDVEAEWLAIHGAIDSILVDGHDVDSAHIIDDHNLKLLELTSILSSDVAGKYARPFEIAYSDAMLIEMAGRQRMFTQKMAKDACEIWTGYHAEEGAADLESTMVNFEATLTALRFGMPSMSIAPAPNDVIAADLDDLLERWGVLKVNLQALLDGKELNEDQKYEVFHDLEVELAALEHLIDDYGNYAERGH